HRDTPEQALDRLQRCSIRAVKRSQVELLAVGAQYASDISRCERYGAAGDRVEYGLRIGLRLADHAQDLARGRLLLQGLGQIAVAHLQLFEEAGVLDGDDGLVGEGLEERNLRIGETASFESAHPYAPDGMAFTQHWHREGASAAESRREGLRIFSVGLHVR